MLKLNIIKALESSEITQEELAAKLWPDSTESGQYQNMRLLIKNEQKWQRIVDIICKETGVDPNFLLNHKL